MDSWKVIIMSHIRSFLRFILVSLALLGLSVSSANAALVTQLLSVEIGGTDYDVTFHAGYTFADLWDGDGDNTLGEDDGSIFKEKPLFWGDSGGAKLAAQAIILRLGDADTTFEATTGTDLFLVPYEYYSSGQPELVRNTTDQFGAPTEDSVYLGYVYFRIPPDARHVPMPFASFAPAALSAVPVPAAVWLFGTALVGLIGFGKRKSKVAV